MQRYSFDHITRAGVVMLIVLCLMGVVGASFVMWFSSEPSHERMKLIPIIVGMIVVAGWLALYYLRMHDSIVVTDVGLTYEPASGQPQVVPWHQIATLAPHSLRGRYDVLDEHNRCVMYVYYDLENFHELDARLREHFRQRAPDGRTTFTIHRAGSKIVFTVGVCCALPFLSTFVFQARELDLMGIFLTCASPLGIWWGLYGTVERIVVTKGGLLIEYWKRTKMIPFSIIQGVTVQGITLSIHRRDQKLFTLQSKWAHPLMPILQKAIETAWKQAMSSQNPL